MTVDAENFSALKWLTMREACLYARLSRNTMKKYINAGYFSGEVADSGQWRVDRESIDAYFGQTRQKALALLREMRV
ncbi:MAG: helix-turn-helix domain-containing protein [Desulfobacteraceae bacterium]|nr:helix-turn-helix domain-containing protein [Desulfobacteraceae bacterium]